MHLEGLSQNYYQQNIFTYLFLRTIFSFSVQEMGKKIEREKIVQHLIVYTCPSHMCPSYMDGQLLSDKVFCFTFARQDYMGGQGMLKF